ncbi:hypothetical protein Vadar_024854 [Vaccinium darrowii]|uniref:Uncharacterized protein n=1 Tax=Vaccinium darrowii TaxID=229202 RepID=A0ACB7XCG5_9ERIC|nr:hypothetical protein Vadar_024854 [Vaccinium darrowii]
MEPPGKISTPEIHPADHVSPPTGFRNEDCSVIEATFENQDWLPQAYIMDGSLPRPLVPFPPSSNVSVLVTDPMTTLWDEEAVVDIRVSNDEVWTVNKAMLDPSFWQDSEMDDLKTKMEAVEIKEQGARNELMNFWIEDQETMQKREAIRAGKRKVNEEYMDFWGENQELWEETVNRITRSGRIYQPAHLQDRNFPNHTAAEDFTWEDPVLENTVTNHPEVITQQNSAARLPPKNPPIANDPIQKQLERTPASVSIWGLLSSSREHRQKLIKALSNMEVPPDTPPETMIALLTPTRAKHVVVFTEKDLPPEGAGHNKPLHITLKCKEKWVPIVLLDNGSALNVCPLRTAYCLGFKNKDFQPSNLGVRAYDNTRRDVIGTIQTGIAIGDFETNVEFHVLDIPSSFNLLLGRPWLHRSDIMAVPSSLHQKVQLGLATGTLTIYGDSGIRPHVPDNAPLLEIIHGEEDITLGGFSFDTSDGVLTIKMDEDFSIRSTALDMMLKMEYLPGLGLGRNNQGVAEFPKFLANNHRSGLGYRSTSNQSKARTNQGPIRFVKAPEAVYLGEPEPFWDMEAKIKLPGFEIFANNTWDSEDETEEGKEPAKMLQVDWIEVLDSGNLLSLFGEESPPGMGGNKPAATLADLKPVEDMELMMLGQEALGDVTTLIMDANGIYKNCTFVPRIIYTGTDFESESESSTASSIESGVESELESVITPRHHFSFEFESTLMYHAPGAPPFEMNEIDFAYLAVSEINCIDPDDEGIEFEEEIPKELRSLIEREDERHAQPIKEEVISINLRDESNPRMVQIGSGLSPEEFKAHSDLLKEFEDVFAWSHADMPGIDPEIVEHRIPLYPDAKPVKQKLRKMRPDWVLEIKKEVQRQIDAGFLIVTEYPQWVANIVPVPKKNGKIRIL